MAKRSTEADEGNKGEAVNVPATNGTATIPRKEDVFITIETGTGPHSGRSHATLRAITNGAFSETLVFDKVTPIKDHPLGKSQKLNAGTLHVTTVVVNMQNATNKLTRKITVTSGPERTIRYVVQTGAPEVSQKGDYAAFDDFIDFIATL